MKIFKRSTLVGLIIFFSFLFSINFVFADEHENDPLTLPTTDLPSDEVQDVLVAAIDWIAGIIATVSVLVVAVGGFLWVTAGGEEDRVKSARRWVTAGLAGLALALSAYILVEVILSFFT